MKTHRTLFFLILMSLLGCGKAPQQATEVGSGGGEYSAEFVLLAKEIAGELQGSASVSLDITKLKEAIEKTRVVAKDNLVLSGGQVDALNFPEAVPARIEMSISGWERMKKGDDRRRLVVLHEYLGILKIEDKNYQVSSSLIEFSGVCSRTPSVRAKLEAILGKSCHHITKDDITGIPTKPDSIYGFEVSENSLKKGDLRFLNFEKFGLWGQGGGLKTFPNGLFKEVESRFQSLVLSSPFLRVQEGMLEGVKAKKDSDFSVTLWDVAEAMPRAFSGLIDPASPPERLMLSFYKVRRIHSECLRDLIPKSANVKYLTVQWDLRDAEFQGDEKLYSALDDVPNSTDIWLWFSGTPSLPEKAFDGLSKRTQLGLRQITGLSEVHLRALNTSPSLTKLAFESLSLTSAGVLSNFRCAEAVFPIPGSEPQTHGAICERKTNQ